MNAVTISKKLIALCSSLLMVTAALGTLSFFNMSRIKQNYADVIQQNLPRQRMTLEFLLHFKNANIELRTLGLAGLSRDQGQVAIRGLTEEINAYDKLSKTYMTEPFLPGEEKFFQTLESNWSSFKVLAEKMLRFHREQELGALSNSMLYEYPDLSAKYKDAAAALVNFHRDAVDLKSRELDEVSMRLIMGTLTFMMVGLFLGFLLAYFIVRSASRHLGELTQNFEKIGRRANAAAGNVAAISQQIASASQGQVSSMGDIASSFEEVSGVVSTTVQGSKNLLNLVTAGNQAMSQFKHAFQQIEESHHRVERLVQVIEEIGEKTEMIDEIVFQTRLLSFNTSVEAERAKDSGRSFAFVAQEIGNLAQISGKGATELSRLVKNSLKTAQDMAQFNRAKMEAGVLLFAETTKQFESLQKAAHDVMRASQESSSGVQKINQNLLMMSKVTQETASSTRLFAETSHLMSEQVGEISHLVGDLEKLVTGQAGESMAQMGEHSRQSLPEEEAPQVRPSEREGRGQVVSLKVNGHKSDRMPLRNSHLTIGVRTLQRQGSAARKEDPWGDL